MKLPFKLANTFQTRSWAMQGGVMGVFLAFTVLSFIQGRLLLKSTDDRTSTAVPTAQAIQARLDELTISLKSYVQNHDVISLQHIQSAGLETDRLVSKLQEVMHDQGNDQYFQTIQKALTGAWDAAHDVLNADHAEAKNEQALDACREISPTQVTHRRFRRSQVQQDPCTKEADDVQLADKHVQDALKHQAGLKDSFPVVLQENLFAHSESDSHRFQMFFSPGVITIVLAALLLLAGILISLAWGVRIQQQLLTPLHGVVRCIEAAAAGDMTAIPEVQAWDEVRSVAEAVERLVKVLGRSETLVYHLASLVDSSGDAIISYTLDGTILSWNKGAQRIYGYSPKEMKGQLISTLAPGESWSEMKYRLERLRNGDRIPAFESIHQARNGRKVKALIRISAMLDSTRKVIGASCCIQDLTEIEQPKPASRPSIKQD